MKSYQARNKTISVLPRAQPSLRLLIRRAAICLFAATAGVSIVGCDEPRAPPELNSTARKLLVGTSMFVTDQNGDATAVWLGRVKVYPPSSPKINDALLGELAALPKLTALYVSNENITDAGMEHLAHMAQLEVLDLRGTSITDRGLQRLESLANLKVLCLANTQVTDGGVEHFEREVRGCDVRR